MAYYCVRYLHRHPAELEHLSMDDMEEVAAVGALIDRQTREIVEAVLEQLASLSGRIL